MRVKFILPALTEAKSPFWRPIKYSLFPPLGLATLASHLLDEDEAELVVRRLGSLTPLLEGVLSRVTRAAPGPGVPPNPQEILASVP